MNIVKKFGFSLVMFMAAFCAQAETETVNGITWTYRISRNEAIIGYGTGTNYVAVPVTTKGSIAIPSTLGGYPVTSPVQPVT